MPLRPQEIEKLKNQLLTMRDDLTKLLKGSAEEVRKPDESKGYSQHQADEGTDDFDRTISLNITTREYETIQSIERALNRIKEGTYGICEITEKEIPLARLEAIPYTTTTREAQEMIERGKI
jgi:DnaK suppressor protein